MNILTCIVAGLALHSGALEKADKYDLALNAVLDSNNKVPAADGEAMYALILCSNAAFRQIEESYPCDENGICKNVVANMPMEASKLDCNLGQVGARNLHLADWSKLSGIDGWLPSPIQIDAHDIGKLEIKAKTDASYRIIGNTLKKVAIFANVVKKDDVFDIESDNELPFLVIEYPKIEKTPYYYFYFNGPIHSCRSFDGIIYCRDFDEFLKIAKHNKWLDETGLRSVFKLVNYVTVEAPYYFFRAIFII